MQYGGPWSRFLNKRMKGGWLFIGKFGPCETGLPTESPHPNAYCNSYRATVYTSAGPHWWPDTAVHASSAQHVARNLLIFYSLHTFAVVPTICCVRKLLLLHASPALPLLLHTCWMVAPQSQSGSLLHHRGAPWQHPHLTPINEPLWLSFSAEERMKFEVEIDCRPLLWSAKRWEASLPEERSLICFTPPSWLVMSRSWDLSIIKLSSDMPEMAARILQWSSLDITHSSGILLLLVSCQVSWLPRLDPGLCKKYWPSLLAFGQAAGSVRDATYNGHSSGNVGHRAGSFKPAEGYLPSPIRWWLVLPTCRVSRYHKPVFHMLPDVPLTTPQACRV